MALPMHIVTTHILPRLADLGALCRASLVCRAWRSTCAPYMERRQATILERLPKAYTRVGCRLVSFMPINTLELRIRAAYRRQPSAIANDDLTRTTWFAPCVAARCLCFRANDVGCLEAFCTCHDGVRPHRAMNRNARHLRVLPSTSWYVNADVIVDDDGGVTRRWTRLIDVVSVMITMAHARDYIASFHPHREPLSARRLAATSDVDDLAAVVGTLWWHDGDDNDSRWFVDAVRRVIQRHRVDIYACLDRASRRSNFVAITD